MNSSDETAKFLAYECWGYYLLNIFYSTLDPWPHNRLPPSWRSYASLTTAPNVAAGTEAVVIFDANLTSALPGRSATRENH